MKQENTDPADPRLNALLRESRVSPALPPRFREGVWRRIEEADAPAPAAGSITWLDALVALVLRPRFAVATAAVLIVAGALLGGREGSQMAHQDAQARYLAAVAPIRCVDAMNRSLAILLGALVLCAALFGGAYAVSRHVCERCMAKSVSDLDWLQQEFHLSDAEMARIQRLHEGYLPKCAEMCAQIAAKKTELETALNGSTNVNPVAQQKLDELAALRAQCQAQMLRHFTEVSQTMPPAEGRRYLAQMQRLTLGLHEQTESSMSDTAGHEHHQP